MSFKTPMHEIQFKTVKKMKNYNWEYFKASDWVLKDMPIAMINMGLRETSNYMNVMIVQNVL